MAAFLTPSCSGLGARVGPFLDGQGQQPHDRALSPWWFPPTPALEPCLPHPRPRCQVEVKGVEGGCMRALGWEWVSRYHRSWGSQDTGHHLQGSSLLAGDLLLPSRDQVVEGAFLLICVCFFLSDSFFSTILSSISLILSSASVILLFVASRVFLISFIALFIIF